MKQKLLILIAFILLSGAAIGQDNNKNIPDSLQHILTEFNQFKLALEMEKGLDDTLFQRMPVNFIIPLQTPNCSEYVLVWVVYNSNHYITPNKSDSLQTLCKDLKRYKKEDRKNHKAKSAYGRWFYHIETIGDKYCIIRGSQAIGSISNVTYYYIKK